MAVRPFSIDVPDAVLGDLKARLAATRWPEPIPGVEWEYGAKTEYIRELCEYWREGFDWRAQERALNAFPGFKAEIDGVDLHFWHVKGKGPNPYPLLLVHGWPGSIMEFAGCIGPLTDPAAHGGDAEDSFDVVVPALPGFGFSSAPMERGWGPARMAKAFDTLMTRELGYSAYGVQGGDWGGIICAILGAAHSDHVRAVHTNFPITAPPPGDLPADEAAEKARRDAFSAGETGYSNVQGTKPDSLTVAQSDSPAGLAAWIVEKFHGWGDTKDGIEAAFTKDQLLTNLMFYWGPNSTASSARVYYESRRDPGQRFGKVEVPTGVAMFPAEPWRVPRRWVEQRYNVTHWTDMPKGGHFAALEQPDLMVADVREFYRGLRPAI